MARDYTIDVLAETMTLLDELCAEGKPVSLAELSNSMRLTKNRIFRILRTLEQYRVVTRDGERYVPGPKMGEWWAKYRQNLRRGIDQARAELKATEIEGVG